MSLMHAFWSIATSYFASNASPFQGWGKDTSFALQGKWLVVLGSGSGRIAHLVEVSDFYLAAECKRVPFHFHR